MANRRKPKGERKDDVLRLRVTDAQRKRIAAAAARDGIGMSAFMLTAALRAADARLGIV